MSSNSSGYCVRRHLSFQDVPCRGKKFYVDSKQTSVRQKLCQRISDLGGEVESFLSKDLDVILIDRDENKKTTTDFNKFQNRPLSRGQALLNAANEHKDNNNNDIIHRAALLGVKTQTVKEFVQATAKFISKIKHQKKTQQKENDFLQGMSPITWDKDKENCYVLKIEDNAQIYRPLFKQLETAPKISYNETGSPFDVGIVLTRQNEGNQSKKKIAKAPTKGGYCESCDHWYKGTLKEHLSSSKHIAFVSSVANFKSLESVSAGLPGLNIFLKKFEPEGKKNNENHLQNSESGATYQHDIQAINVAQTSTNSTVTIETNPSERIGHSTWIETNYVTSVNDKDKYTSDNMSIPLPTLVNKESIQSSTTKEMSIDAVLQDIFSDKCAENDGQTHGSVLDNFVPVGTNTFNAPGLTHTDHKTGKETNQTSQTNQNQLADVDNQLQQCLNPFNSNFVPESNFSSSSCSFGDHGVANVLTFLQSHDSQGANGKKASGCQSIETVSTDKCHNSRESCVVKGSVTSLESVNAKSFWEAPMSMEQFVKVSSEQDDKNAFPFSGENHQSTKNAESVSSQKDITSACGKLKLCPYEMKPTIYNRPDAFIEQIKPFPDLVNCDTSKIEAKLHVRTNHITTHPDYSNITEESISSEIPKVESFKPIKCDQSNKSISNQTSNQTPSKEENEALRDEMMKNVANSGATWSSIRNWLLPGDNDVDNGNKSGQDLDKTLVQDSGHKGPEAVDITVNKECDISNIFNENSAESSNNFVAAWIKNQKFEVSGESENFHQGIIGENVQQADGNNNMNNDLKPCAIESEGKVGEDDRLFDVIESVQRDNAVTLDNVIGSDAGHTNYTSDDISDCTSISDCTLENFKVSHVPICPDDIESERKEEAKKSRKDSDCMSQKSSISCQLTDRGIKIKGLLSVKPVSEHSNIPDKKASQNFKEDNSKTDGYIPNDNSSQLKHEIHMKNPTSVSSSEHKNSSDCAIPVTEKQSITKSENSCPSITGVNSSDVKTYQEIGNSVIKGKTILSGTTYPNSDYKSAVDFQCHQRKTSVGSEYSNPKYLDSPINSPHNYNSTYSPISQTSQVNQGENPSSCMQNRSSQAQQMVPSPLMNDGGHNVYGNMQNYKHYNGASMAGYNTGVTQWDYFNTGILPFETQCMSYNNHMGSFQSELNHSYASSSYYMNNTTDYLAMSSPRQTSTPQQNIYGSQGNMYEPYLQDSMQGAFIQNNQYPVSTHSVQHTQQPASVCNSKPTVVKKNGRKTGKRKRNDSQPSFLSSTSSFHTNNPTPLSHCGFSSGVVEPTHSLQSDWYPSSPQSAVSSAGLSTIRTEDIAEVNCDYSYYKMAVPKKRKITQTTHHQANSAVSHPRESAIVNSSTPNSQCYMSPHSALYEKMANHQQVNNIQNTSSLAYSHLSQGTPFSSPIYQGSPYQVPQHVSQTFPSQLHQQQSQYDTSQSNLAMSVTNNPFSYQQPTMNSFSAHSTPLIKPVIHDVNSKFNTNFSQSNQHENQVSQVSNGCVYNAVQTGETRLKLRKIPVSRPEQQNDLKNYWNVRKAGDCRLVFSMQIGKRKASEEIPSSDKYGDYSGLVKSENIEEFHQEYHHAKKRRCLVY